MSLLVVVLNAGSDDTYSGYIMLGVMRKGLVRLEVELD